MKKHVITWLVVLLSACMFVGCNTNTDEEKESKKNDTETEIETETNDMMQEDEDEEEEHNLALEEMRQEEIDKAVEAIKEHVENYSDPISDCMFVYIDKDDIPEFYFTIYGNGVLLVYYDGEVKEHYVHSSSGGLYYIEKENRILISDGRMDVYSDYVYSVRSGELETIAEGYYGLEDNTELYDEEGNPIPYTYEWNGTDVTEEEYEEALAKAFDESMAIKVYYEAFDTFEEAYENFGVVIYETDSCNVYKFELEGDVLKVETDGGRPFTIRYPVSSDCVWYRCYLGSENKISSELSFEEIKEILKSNRELEKEGSYTMWTGFAVKVKNNEVIAVYIVNQ